MSARDLAERRARAEEALFSLYEEEELELQVAKEEARRAAGLLSATEEGGISDLGDSEGPSFAMGSAPIRSRTPASTFGPSAGEEFTARSLIVGTVVGGTLSLMNIYMGFKLTIWQPVGLPATIIGFAVMRTAVARLGPILPHLFGAPFGWESMASVFL